jgi:hypothetical protein
MRQCLLVIKYHRRGHRFISIADCERLKSHFEWEKKNIPLILNEKTLPILFCFQVWRS